MTSCHSSKGRQQRCGFMPEHTTIGSLFFCINFLFHSFSEIIMKSVLYNEFIKSMRSDFMEKNIEIKNLCKVYGNITILDDINYVAKEWRETAFLVPNGAGKSSTLRILIGLDQATSGSATISGINYKDIRNPLFVVGATFDGLGSPSDRTVYQHLRIVAASNGIKKSRIDEVLAVTDITHKKNESIGHLSLGETQRVSLATALLGNPQFLILDEPTNGLDPSGIRWLRNFLKEQSEKGKTILLSSHILSEVEAVTDDVVFIHKGKIIANGELKKIMKDAASLEEVFFNLIQEGGKEDEVIL